MKSNRKMKNVKKSKPSVTQIETKVRVNEATGHLKNKHYNKALALYNKALELSPSDKNALLARSKCYLLLGEPQKALSDAEAALNEKMNDSNNARAIFYKAESLYHLGDFELSLVFYYRGIRIRPEFDQFRLGVQKAKEAIQNILDHCAPIEIDSQMERRGFKKLKFYNLLTKTAEIDDKIQQANGEKIIQHQNNSSTELFEKFKNSSAINRESSNLLGQLNVDKKYLQELIKRPDIKTAHQQSTQNILKYAEEGISFLKNRQEFWRQQKSATRLISNK